MAVQTNRLHKDQFEFLKKFPFVLAVPDGDSGGDMFIDSLAEYIPQQSFLVAQLPRGKDPGDMDDDPLDMCIQEARDWAPVVEGTAVEFDF